MLSPATHYKQVPTNYNENIILREEILRATECDPGHQQALLEMCAEDILFFKRLFMWQYNPFEMEKGPFIPRPYQEAAIVGGDITIDGQTKYQHGLLESIEDAKTVRWPKSRYVGATWVCVGVAVWLALFKDNVKGLVLSKDEKTAEDSEDPDSLFWKIQFMLSHLPAWMRRGSEKRKKGVFKFWNGNTITSTANVESAGVGGRCTFMFVDEFGQFAKGHEIFSMTKDTARCRVFVGTHKGRGTMLHDLCFDPKYVNMREIITHWSMDEEKSKGAYRYISDHNSIEIIDTKFDYAGICDHGISTKTRCDACQRTGFKPFHFVYDVKPTGGPCPGVRSPWYDVETRERSDYDVAMNLDIDPTGSSITFFDSYRIAVLKSECVAPFFQGDLIYDKHGMPVRLDKSSTGLLKLWVHPKGEAELPRMSAGAAVDVSSGVGYSPSCISVFNLDTGEKVLQYANADLLTHEFAVFVVAALRMIKNTKGMHPLLCWELQGSEVFEQVVLKLGYAPYYMEERTGPFKGNLRSRPRAGANVRINTIKEWMEDYRAALYARTIFNYDEHALDETLNFVYVGNGVEYKARLKGRLEVKAESGASWHHGDIVRADALAYKMLKQQGFDGAEIAALKDSPPEVHTSAWREWLGAQEREEEEVWA